MPCAGRKAELINNNKNRIDVIVDAVHYIQITSFRTKRGTALKNEPNGNN